MAYGHPPSLFAILCDSGTLGIVSVATGIIVYSSKNCVVPGALQPFTGSRDDQETPIKLTARKAAIFPVVGSVVLLLLYKFFDHIEFLYLLFNAVIAGICLEMAIRNPISLTIKPPIPKGIYLPFFGSVPTAIALSSAVAFIVTFMWVLSDSWMLLDALGAGLCTFMLNAVRLPNLKTAMILFIGLLFYDIFWVFFSSRMFETNVMVNVATKTGENPVQSIASTLSLPMARGLPKLSIPAKIMVPSSQRGGDYSILGLGDIVLPGMLVVHNLRFDLCTNEFSGKALSERKYYFYAICGYAIGLAMAIVCSEKYESAQPALIYLLPATVVPTIVLSYSRGDLLDMWHGFSLAKQSIRAISVDPTEMHDV